MIGLVTGTGLHRFPGLGDVEPRRVETPFGDAEVAIGRVGDVAVAHVARHGEGHLRLSNHTRPRVTIAAMAALGVRALVSTTVCGAVDPAVALGSLVVFDDLHFPSNRLPDGSLCTLFTEEGASGRGHWIFDRPFAAGVRAAVLDGAREAGVTAVDGGVYGHVDGPRLNSRPEIAALAAAGVRCVSQTGGPETVLAGEAGIPFALVGFVTDHANGVADPPTPVAVLERLLGESGDVLGRAVTAALPRLAADPGPAAGFVYRIG